MRAFNRSDDGWAIRAWLASPHAALGGERPIDRNRIAHDLDRVAALAGDASRRWAS